MDRQIEKIFEKICNDKNLSEKLIKINNVYELSDLFISLGAKLSKEQLSQYFTDMYKNMISENSLEKISGGKIMSNKNFNKAISLSLAALSLSNPLSPTLYAYSNASSAKNFNSSSKNDKDNEKSKWSQIKDHVQKHAIAYGVGAATTLGMLAYCFYSWQKDNVPADTWANRLGITQHDISSYCNLWNDQRNNVNIAYNNIGNLGLTNQIKLDFNRTNYRVNNININFGNTAPHSFRAFRIAYLYYTHQEGWQNKPSGGYTQGENDFLGAIYCKFLQWHPELMLADYDDRTSLETEAKIYYVFSEFMKIIKSRGDFFTNNYRQDLLENFCRLKHIEINPQRNTVAGFHKELVELFLFKSLQTLNTQIFKLNCWINIWNHIIMDDNIFIDGRLDYAGALTAMGNIALSQLLSGNYSPFTQETMDGIQYMRI